MTWRDVRGKNTQEQLARYCFIGLQNATNSLSILVLKNQTVLFDFSRNIVEKDTIRGPGYFKTENNCNITGFMRWQKVMNRADERLSKS